MNGPTNLFLSKKKNTWVKSFLAVIILIVFFIGFNALSDSIKNIFFSISYRLEKNFWKAGETASAFFASFLDAKNLAKDNEKLKQENQNLLAEVSSLRTLNCQNEAAVSVFGACQQDNFELLSANVIGLDNFKDIISIDKGSDDGISENMPVINQQKVLFGKVVKVYKNFSEVMLISNKSNVLDVKIMQNDEVKPIINGVIKGNGGLGVYLDLVPVNEEINQGDVLVTSALEGDFPKDLLIGKITKKEKNDQKPFQQAQVEPFFNIKNTESLFVIVNYKR